MLQNDGQPFGSSSKPTKPSEYSQPDDALNDEASSIPQDQHESLVSEEPGSHPIELSLSAPATTPWWTKLVIPLVLFVCFAISSATPLLTILSDQVMPRQTINADGLTLTRFGSWRELDLKATVPSFCDVPLVGLFAKCVLAVESGNGNVGIGIIRMSALLAFGATLEDYEAAVWEQYQLTFNNPKLVSSDEITISGEQAFRRVFDLSESDLDLTMMVVIVREPSGTILLIASYGLEEEFDRNRSQLDEMIASIQLIASSGENNS